MRGAARRRPDVRPVSETEGVETKKSRMKTTVFGCARATLGFGLGVSTAMAASWQTDADVEWFRTDDIDLISGVWVTERVEPLSRWRIEFNADRIALDYAPNEPIDPFGSAASRDEENFGVRIAWREERGRWRGELSGSVYDGFRSFSDVWLDEYYRQQYEGSPLPGVAYQRSGPRGYGGSASLRYEYLPATAYVSAVVGLYADRVSPGYEVEDLGASFELTRGESHLSTAVASVVFENAVSSWARMRHTFSLSDTTTRDARWGWTGELNLALGSRWVSRTAVAANREEPSFESWSLSQVIEYKIAADWFLSLGFRRYEDTGQIETANLVSSAAPALRTTQWTVGLRWISEDLRTHLSLEAGPYTMNYAPTGLGTERFLHLYQERDWTFVRAAWHYEF